MSDVRLPVIPADMPIIDTHVHVWKTSAPWMAWLEQRPQSWDVVRRNFSWRELRGLLDTTGVARLILVQAGTSVRESRSLLELAAVESSVAGVIGWATLTEPAATEADLDALALADSGGLVGVRSLHQWEPDGDILARPQVLDACRVVAERGLALDLFFNDHTQLPLAVALAGKAPAGMRLVIDHLGRPPIGAERAFGAWADAMAALSEFPDVYVKYSGWATVIQRVRSADVRPYVEFVLERFGSSRVMYASNWPVALVAGGYQETFGASLAAVADLPPADLAAVLAGTAQRCYLTTAP